MCMNGPLIIMAFDPLFGLWAEVRMVSDFDIKFMPLSKLNRG